MNLKPEFVPDLRVSGYTSLRILGKKRRIRKNKGKCKESESKPNRISYALSHRSGTERVYKDLYRLEKRKLFFEQLGIHQSIIAYRTNIPPFDTELPSPISGSVSSQGLTRVINNKL
ncbi:hypothetical protein L873DRAFT_1807180, partial [Choiromyces venosus 120613-1]